MEDLYIPTEDHVSEVLDIASEDQAVRADEKEVNKPDIILDDSVVEDLTAENPTAENQAWEDLVAAIEPDTRDDP